MNQPICGVALSLPRNLLFSANCNWHKQQPSRNWTKGPKPIFTFPEQQLLGNVLPPLAFWAGIQTATKR